MSGCAVSWSRKRSVTGLGTGARVTSSVVAAPAFTATGLLAVTKSGASTVAV